jgi:hypothetical protein
MPDRGGCLLTHHTLKKDQMLHADKRIQLQQHYKHESYKAMAAISTGHEKQKHLEKYCTKTSHAIKCTLSIARHTYILGKEEIH